MSEPVNYVDATFDGKKRRLEVRRERVVALEDELRRHAHDDDIVMGASAYAALKRLWGGGWTATDIEQTLAFAMEEQTEAQKSAYDTARAMSLHAVRMGMPFAFHPGTYFKPGDPMPAIKRDGHAAYVSLVERILRATLFGITPEEADFDNYKEPEADE